MPAVPTPPVLTPPVLAPPVAPPVLAPPVAAPVLAPPVAAAAPMPPVPAPPAGATPASAPPVASPPSVTVTGDRPDGRPLRVVERALRGPADKRGDGWHDRVVVVPGGHRPGRPDFQQRDRARAQLPVAGSRRIVVLGCTVGAGQTMTTLMTGEVLASVRDEPVAVLDLNSGRGSLAERAGSRPAVAAGQAPAGPDHLHHSPAPSRLAVISSDAAEAAGPPDDAGRDVAKIFEMISARYSLTLADPAASAVPRVLAIADQLVLVAPASQDAARAIAMTLEWLEAHGYAGLAGNSATVINGVSRQTMTHVEQAEAVARGRCRAIVRVPWDDQLRNPGRDRRPAADPVAPLAWPGGRLLGPAAVQAYTALAGVLVAGLATAPELRRAQL
jgi:MinD-like ATPase involved in chromosome partitioning or flagellar assembly